MRSTPGKIGSFDAASLALIDDLCDSTWRIFELRHPFRDLSKDDDVKRDVRLKIFILAENRGLANPDDLQRSALEALSRKIDLQ
jgi:hypothetical protein